MMVIIENAIDNNLVGLLANISEKTLSVSWLQKIKFVFVYALPQP